MSRPLFHARINDLEADFNDRRGDADYLRVLLDELEHRSSDRAKQLQGRVLAAVRTLNSPAPSPGMVQPGPGPVAAQPPGREPAGVPDPIQRVPKAGLSPVDNAPTAILDVWTALEVLSPPSFRRPEDLSGGDRAAVARLDGGRLPWEGAGEKARPNKRLYYQVVLGTVDLDGAVTALLSRYTDTRAERPQARGEAILAVVILDRSGRPVEAPTALLSSFGWGLQHALRGDLRRLSEWRTAERPLLEQLDRVLRQPDDKGEPRSLDQATLTKAFNWLVATVGMPRELVRPPCIAIRNYEYFKSTEPPESLLLNSFFLEDLEAAKSLVRGGRVPRNLRLYLGAEVPAAPRDLLHDADALEEAIAPGKIPPARWPGEGRHPLVLLQQAAVNLALHELSSSGILAVNGPPGTGKTTLLRDLVAALVTRRAEAMAAFDDPVKAFAHSGEKLKAGQSWLHLYRLDSTLKGFEMLVASSNNKAVENVSAELPALKAIAEDAHDLRYFTVLSDVLLGRETWGLVAAVLGNAANRARFRQTFWWDDEVGLSKYLASASGSPQVVEVVDPTTGESESRPPRIVTEGDAPRDHTEAMERWKRVRSSFRAKLRECRNRLDELARVRDLAASLPSLAAALSEAAEALRRTREEEARIQEAAKRARERFGYVQAQSRHAADHLTTHDQNRPGFFARLFRTRRARSWTAVRVPLAAAVARSRDDLSAAAQALAAVEEELRAAAVARDTAQERHATTARRHQQARQEVEQARARIGTRFVDADFLGRDHATLHKSAPWLSGEEQRLRDEVFTAAVALHKAFVDAAAKPIRHNLGVLMNGFGRGLPAEKQPLVPELWASLFLVVPLVSTTFASVERMLGNLPPETIGWLLVDEAGQAVPQAGVGAILRARRAVVVGDPMQIEPVVVLPDTLVQVISRHFGVDPDRFTAPNASVQTLADAATPYVAEFPGRHGSRTVGVPLLVHRRCAQPMFGISNTVAYERLMVDAKAPKSSPIGDVLGPSAWIDVAGSAEDKWSPEEGDEVLRLLRRLAAAEMVPDLYIVTPFVMVADQLRRKVGESGVLTGWTDNPRRWTSERIGTVHTVQGREAEAVIFVLGAPSPEQTGARGWAGGRPNLLNVAVSRAKERLYVVGNRRLWRTAGVFRELDASFP